jgi:hypothetical protein
MSHTQRTARKSSTSSLLARSDLDLPTAPLLVKSKSFAEFNGKLPFVSKLVYSQGKLVHSKFTAVPQSFRRKLSHLNHETGTGAYELKSEELSGLKDFFKKGPRLNFDKDDEQTELNNPTEIIQNLRQRVQGIKRVLGKLRRTEKPRKLIWRSKRHSKLMDIYESDDSVFSFPEAQSRSLHRHVMDDDVDTDEEQVEQGVFRSFTNFLEGLKDASNELKQANAKPKLKPSTSISNMVEGKKPEGQKNDTTVESDSVLGSKPEK